MHDRPKELKRKDIRHEDVMAVNVEITSAWDVKPCNLVDIYELSGRTCCIYIYIYLQIKGEAVDAYILYILQM
jgi:hypothetical protein